MSRSVSLETKPRRASQYTVRDVKQEEVERDSISLEQESMCRLESITRDVSKAVIELLELGKAQEVPERWQGQGWVDSQRKGRNPGKDCELQLQIKIYPV